MKIGKIHHEKGACCQIDGAHLSIMFVIFVTPW